MYDEKIIKNILARLERLEKLFEKKGDAVAATVKSSKPITLPELARKSDLKNGQHRIAAIVGYNEVILKKSPINTAEIQELWRVGKFPGVYAFIFIQRAVKEGLVRENRQANNIVYDLTQTGEDFFAENNTIMGQ